MTTFGFATYAVSGHLATGSDMWKEAVTAQASASLRYSSH